MTGMIMKSIPPMTFTTREENTKEEGSRGRVESKREEYSSIREMRQQGPAKTGSLVEFSISVLL